MGKGENAVNQHFLLYPQCSQNVSFLGSLKVRIVVNGTIFVKGSNSELPELKDPPVWRFWQRVLNVNLQCSKLRINRNLIQLALSIVW